ncbi:hypothetical protein RB598_009591 [Gaeumannomyces tritici]
MSTTPARRPRPAGCWGSGPRRARQGRVFWRLSGPSRWSTTLVSGPAHLLIVVSSVFGLSVLLTAQVCNEALGETPPELLKAALVAAVPIQLETAIRINKSCKITLLSYHHPEITPSGKEYKKIGKARMLVTLLIRYLQIIGWDALCGYTFATMAGSLGRPVCSRTAAAAAGVKYYFAYPVRRFNFICHGPPETAITLRPRPGISLRYGVERTPRVGGTSCLVADQENR